MLEITDEHYEELKELYLHNDFSKFNIADTTRLWCMKHKVEYNDSLRRKVSKILRRGLGEYDPKSPTTAKILVYDIETSPLLAYTFSPWQTNIRHTSIKQDWKILSFSAKWLFSNEVISFRLSPEELKTFDDKRITNELWNLLDNCDIAIAHNGIKFDNKKANAKFLEHKLPPTSSFFTIDTCYHAKKRFGFTYNSLDYLGKFLGFGGKLETKSGLWDDVMAGDYESLVQMDEYCQRDVKLLEDVYLAMRPFIAPHPHVGVYVIGDKPTCPSCGHDELHNIHKDYATTVNIYEAYRCTNCEALSRKRKPIHKANQNILSSLPR